MEFQLEQTSSNVFAFQYKEDGELLADISWVQNGDIMTMDHTVVSPKLQGQGVAKKLLDRAADHARENNYKMEAVCSYVRVAFQKGDAYNDVKI